MIWRAKGLPLLGSLRKRASYTRELAEHVARGNQEGFPAPEYLLLSDLGVSTEGLNNLGERIWLLSNMVANKTTVRLPPT